MTTRPGRRLSGSGSGSCLASAEMVTFLTPFFVFPLSRGSRIELLRSSLKKCLVLELLIRHDRTSRQPTNLKQHLSVPVRFQYLPVPPVLFLTSWKHSINGQQMGNNGWSEYKNFWDETDFWKISGFDHACCKLCKKLFNMDHYKNILSKIKNW